MSGWSASGFRVYLGANISSETREFSIYVGGELNSIRQKKRAVTVETAEFRGLTKAGAEAKAATAGWTIIARDRAGETGQWVVREEITTYGAWVEI